MKTIWIIAAFILAAWSVRGQCPAAGFSVQSPVCAGAPLVLSNTTLNGNTYDWNFCPYPDFDTVAVVDYGNGTGLLGNVYGIGIIRDSVNHYAFAVNGANQLVRADFGNDMHNTPVVSSPGNLSTGSTRAALTFVRDGSTWLAFTCTYGGDIYRLNFGNSLTNMPTVTHLSTVINSGIYSIDLARDSDEYVMLACSYDNKNVTLVNFGGNLYDPAPPASIIPATSFPGVNGLLDVDIVNECDHWYAIVLSYNGLFFKLDFGTQLSNTTPTCTQVYSTSASNIRGAMFRIDDTWKYFFYNNSTGVRILDFGASMTSNSPTLLSSALLDLATFGSIEAANFIYSNGTVSGVCVPYSAPGLQRFEFTNSCAATVRESRDAVPAGVSYLMPGTYRVQLQACDTLGHCGYASGLITVNAAPFAGFSYTNPCEGQSSAFVNLTTIPGGTMAGYTWYFGDGDSAVTANAFHAYTSTGDYPVRLVGTATSGCSDADTQIVHIAWTPDAGIAQVSGCSDQALAFHDSSSITAGTIATWSWDFGDSAGTSALPNPAYSYADGGTYTVRLIVASDSGCSDTAFASVIVRSSPDAAFDVSNTCVGLPVQFIDQTVSDSAIVSYAWDFGDATTDTARNPNHTYPAVVGSYAVKLVTVASNGCSDTVNTTVKVNNIPVAAFTSSPANACEGNTVTFTDLSTVSGDTISKWLWTFGDGFFDTTASPVHVYGAPGNYTASLIAYAATSCGSSTSNPITVIASPVARFGFTPVCMGVPTPFFDSTIVPVGSTITSYHWDFGDGDTAIVPSPSHLFTTAGMHTVVLSVQSNFGCTDEDTLVVTVHPPPSASFTHANPCSDYPVSFASTSSAPVPYSIASYTWNFGDPASGGNNVSALPSPSHTFDTTNAYAVTLIVTTDAGCSDTAFEVMTVQQSSIVNFQYSPTCKGDYTDFTNLTLPPSLDTAWYWSFGDGQYSIFREPAHYYVTQGTYQVTLTVTATNGCVSEATKTVTVSPIPVADFTVTPACIGTPYVLHDNSTIAPGSTIVSWRWVANGVDSSSLQQPAFLFPDTGLYPVTLTVTSSDNCSKSVTKNIRVYPVPVANFSFTPQYGVPPLDVNFTNLTTGANAYQWTFGDGGSSTVVNPSNTYQDTGKFTITLIGQSQQGCLDTAVKSIYVIKPILDIAVQSVSSHITGNHLYMDAIVKNLGTRDITRFDISAEMPGSNAIQETYTGLLPNGSIGSTMAYNFHASFSLTDGQTPSYFCVRVSAPNGEEDAVPSNDEKCATLGSVFTVKAAYPNPFAGHLNVDVIVPYSDVLTVELFDASGKKVLELFNGTAAKGLNAIDADLSFLAAGIYALKCTFRDDVAVQSVVRTTHPK